MSSRSSGVRMSGGAGDGGRGIGNLSARRGTGGQGGGSLCHARQLRAPSVCKAGFTGSAATLS